MLSSTRRHAFSGGNLHCDRWLSTKAIVRRTATFGVSQDERISLGHLGRGTASSHRSRILVATRGSWRGSLSGKPLHLGPGEAILASSLDDLVSEGGESEVLMVDWESSTGAHECGGAKLRLGPLGARTVVEAAAAMERRERDQEAMAALTGALDRMLRSEGVDPEVPLYEPHDSWEQEYLDVIDALLGDLESTPRSIDFELRTGTTRRTLTRKTRMFHERYRVFGLGGQTDFRSVKEFYRLLLATIFLSAEDAQVGSVARAVGFTGAAALDHAFARIGLPSPSRVRTSARAALRS